LELMWRCYFVKGEKLTDKENADAKLEYGLPCLLDDLDGAVGALALAGSAYEAFFNFDW
jgi:hypothetical protein